MRMYCLIYEKLTIALLSARIDVSRRFHNRNVEGKTLRIPAINFRIIEGKRKLRKSYVYMRMSAQIFFKI